MRVRIDIDGGAVPATTLEVTPAVGAGADGGAINGGSPSAELLAAVAAAGGLEPPAPSAVAATDGQAAEAIDAGPAPG
jgi:hypothetical protein